jgi:CBS domain-containing protein
MPIDGHVDNLAVVVRICLEILNVDAAFGIFAESQKNRCMVIGRSQIESIDVGSIMRSMGGEGGHPRAGSAQIKGASPEAVERWIQELIGGNQQASVQVSDLMSFPVQTVTAETSIEEVALILRARGITGIPVVDGERVVGMISRRDFRKMGKEAQIRSPVWPCMTTDVLTIEPGKSPTQAAQ